MILQKVLEGDTRSIARSISLIENEADGYEAILSSLPSSNTPVTGITGPPGAGKSTLVDALIGKLVSDQKSVAVLCVDPSSPFNLGALLGDRIRMSEWYNHPKVYIRSLATRGSLGGLNPKIIEISDLLKAAPFDHVIIETVGVGQSEVEIASLADTTVVVLVPESGDQIQNLKAGLMEIADIFVVNKSDRAGADLFINNLQLFLRTVISMEIPVPVIKTMAADGFGIDELVKAISARKVGVQSIERKFSLLAEKAFLLIQKKRMESVNKEALRSRIRNASDSGSFNLYKFVEDNY